MQTADRTAQTEGVIQLDVVPELNALAKELRRARCPSSIISRLADGVEFTARSNTIVKLQALRVRDDAEDVGGVCQTFRECLDAIAVCHKQAQYSVAKSGRESWNPVAERALFRQWKVVIGQILVISQMMEMTDFVNLAPMLLNVADSRRKSNTAATLVREPQSGTKGRIDNQTVSIVLPEQARDADVVVLNCQVEIRQNKDGGSRSVPSSSSNNTRVVLRSGRDSGERRSIFSFWRKRAPSQPQEDSFDVPPRYDEVEAINSESLVEKAGLLSP